MPGKRTLFDSQAIRFFLATLMFAMSLVVSAHGQTFTVISHLGDAVGGLTFDSAGNLYGATAEGGTGGFVGTIFELSPASDGTWTETVLFDFADLNAAGPQGPLTFDAAGNLYGTTVGADIVQNIAYELSPTSSGWSGTVLSTLGFPYSAVSPSNLIFDNAGNLYGTTAVGGLRCMYNKTGCGTVFRLSPLPGGGWQQTDLYHFKDKGDGAVPEGGLVMDSAGNLYGTAVLGGTETGVCVPDGYYPGCGVVFELSPTASGPWKEKVLYRFSGAGDGGYPQGGLIFDAVGNLYGTAAGGGVDDVPGGYGVVFKLTPRASGAWKERVLYVFLGENENDGYLPNETLVFDPAGNLYGTTRFGGGHANCQGTETCGIAFKLTPRKSGYWAEHILHRFDGGEGGAGQPTGPLILDSAGNLYGTTTWAAFKITP